MKILMFHGRAGGHNILPFLDYFNNSDEHQLTFVYSNDRVYFPGKTNIEFIKFSFSPLQLGKTLSILRRKYDLIWHHGGHSAVIFYIFSHFRNKDSFFIFNLWNEWLVHKAMKGGFRGNLFKKSVRKSDAIHCNWFGTAEVAQTTGWNKNVKVFFWGLDKDYFRDNYQIEAEETRKFIGSLPTNKVKLFFPKSLSPNSRHDLVIDAAHQLFSRGIENFIIYMWLGNTNDARLLLDYQNQLSRLGLREHIKFVKHGFLSFTDMCCIWQEMDAGLQIAANDLLSTTFLEPQFFKKELVVTDIRPYQLYNEKFPVKIPLVPLEAAAIAERMEKIISGERTAEEILDVRNRVIKENFNMRDNLQRILDHYEHRFEKR